MENTKFRPTAILPNNLDDIVILAIHCHPESKHTRVLTLLNKKDDIKLPKVSFDAAEPIESTLRREVYGMSGCLLRYASMFGVIYDKEKSIACYIGAIADIENIKTENSRLMLNIDDVIKKAMKDDFWSYDAKVSFLHFGYKEFQLLEKRYWERF